MNERQIAEKMVADAEAMAKEGRAKLKALDEPKLRHGDYGYDKEGLPCMRVFSIKEGKLVDASSTATCSANVNHLSQYRVKTKIGNIFDDLARNAEDLEEFEVDGYIVCINEFGNIDFKTQRGKRTMFKKEATEIHQKLGQLIATAKRRQK